MDRNSRRSLSARKGLPGGMILPVVYAININFLDAFLPALRTTCRVMLTSRVVARRR